MSADELELIGRARDVAKYQTYGDIDNLLRALADALETAEAKIHAHDGYKMHAHWEECESVSELREALRFQGAMTHELIPHQERAIRAEARIERALAVWTKMASALTVADLGNILEELSDALVDESCMSMTNPRECCWGCEAEPDHCRDVHCACHDFIPAGGLFDLLEAS